MKTIIITLTISVISLALFAQQRSEENCITCDNNTVEVRNGASALGTQNISTGINSFAVGRENQALGDYSIAMPLVAKAIGQRSVAIGYLSNANANQSIALGSYSHTKSNATLSIAIGSYVSTQNIHSFVMGFGSADTLKNNIEKSLMIGFNSNLPTLFVSPSSGSGKTGKIGIGNITNSDYKLHILSDEDEAAELKLEHRTTGANQIARIYLGSHKIEASSNSHMNFYTTNSSQHFNFYNGTIRSEQGTAAAPSYSFRLSPTTGMFRPSTNTIAFSTGGQERVRINSSGNVGIGTNNPGDYKLAVAGSGFFSGVLSVTGSGNSSFNGNVGIGTTTPDKKLVVAGDISFTGDLYKNGVLFNSSNWTVAGSNIYRASGNVGIGNSNPIEKLDVTGWVNTSSGYKVGTSTVINENSDYSGGNGTFTGVLSVTGSGNSNIIGNFGIGTNAPDAKFHVKANESSTFTAKIQTGTKSVYFGRAIYSETLAWGNSYIGLGLYRDGDNSWKTEVDAAANGGAMIWGTIGGSLAFTCIPTNTQPGQQALNDAEIKANTRMYLTSTGVLKVNEVLVKANIWSDYVFHDEYKLPDLYEVEKYISENRHLPDIPSEKIVMEEGINLGEMDALLLKKIEELTLYVIELKKENEVMRHQIEQLAK